MQTRKKRKKICIIVIGILILLSGCSRPQSATNNSKIAQNKNSEVVDSTNVEQNQNNNDTANSLQDDSQATTSTAIDPSQLQVIQTENKPHSSLNYNCDIEKDKETFDQDPIDITVGDDFYATQINDWYTNFDDYEGKSVEIEGFYIADYLPYLFVGRFGPTCPYCQGGYICFEFYTKEDLAKLESGKDWIKVKGILRKDVDETGEFNYIEVMSIEKMEQVGVDTVTN